MNSKTLISLFALISLVLSVTATAQTTNLVVTDSDRQGWLIAPDEPAEVPVQWIAGSSTLGVGSLEFGPIGSTPAAKFVMYPPIANLPTDEFDFFSFDFEVLSGTIQDFYMNIYVDSSSNGLGTFTNGFYDCRYDQVSNFGGINQWSTTVGDSNNTIWTNVVNGTGDCSIDFTAIDPGSLILFIAVNGGQSIASDVGLSGRFDGGVFRFSDGRTTVWDFEPDAVIPPGGAASTPGIPTGSSLGMALLMFLLLGTALVRLRA